MNKELSIRPQKVLLVITKSNWGGAQKYVYDVATSLHASEWDIQVASGGHGEMLEKLRAASVPVHKLTKLRNNMNPFSTVLACAELISLYRKERPDVVHVNSSKVGLFGAVAARIARVPHIVFTAHGWPFNEDRPRWQKKVLRILMQLTVLASHKTICVSQKTFEDLQASPSLAKKCTIIHNGIETIPFKPATAFYEERHLMRRQKIALVSIGELHPSKGFDLALSYLKELDDISWEWFILGEGKERKSLEELVAHYHLTDRVHLVGHTKEAALYLKAFDLFFLPSRTEALAYVALEALQTNLPIIASNVGGVPEVLGNDPGTTLISIRNPDTRETLHAILSSPIRKIEDSERATLREAFSLHRMIEETVKVYTRIL
jgi:glycosyltransferase involved in cell wall biosynthesis